MKLTLVNFQSEEEINLDAKDPVIVGRGSLSGCTDKRISRKHGQIQLTPEGNVHLLALHSNPCFFMKNGLPPVLQLTKNEEKILSDGDYIGLLPDSCWYKIVVKNNDSENHLEILGNGSNDLKNHLPLKDEIGEIKLDKFKAKTDEHHLKSNQDTEPQRVDEPSKASSIDDDELSKKTEPNEEVSNGVDTTNKQTEGDHTDESKQVESTDTWLKERLKALEKTKRLPLFMYEIDDFPEYGENINIPENIHHSLKDNTTKPAERGDCIEEDSATLATSAKDPVLDITSNENTPEKELKVNKEIKESENIAHCSTTNFTEMETSEIDSPTKTMNTGSNSSQKRPICQYEENCYRKNEHHLREFCHPGDSDFTPYTKRPKCQYGASCYRQNKTHHTEFQHPQSRKKKGKSPTDSPRKKRQRKKEETYRESSEEDFDDLEDPFAVMDSSDEYIPSDLDSED